MARMSRSSSTATHKGGLQVFVHVLSPIPPVPSIFCALKGRFTVLAGPPLGSSMDKA